MKARQLFGIDLRALAFLRMGLGALILADLALRARDLEAHYTDAGVLPRAVLEEHPLGQILPFVSFHLAHGSLAWQGALFAVAAALAVALLVGWHTRLATAGSWLLLMSLQNRNPLLHYGGDNVLVLLLLWSLFLPLGARFSLDAAGAMPPRSGSRGVVASWGSAGLLVQVACLHFFSALHKRAPEWIPDGTALEYALHVDKFVRPFGVVLRELPALTKLLTYGSFGLEVVGPFLLFAPAAFLRSAAVLAFLAFHVGIALCMDLVLFSWISAVSVVVFLPPSVWDGLLRRWERRAPGVATEGGGAQGAVRTSSRGASMLAAVALAFVIFWNVVTLRADWQEAAVEHPVLRAVVTPALLLRLGQTWGMFAPHPPKETRWHAVTGLRSDGRRVDLLFQRPAPPRLSKPPSADGYYPTGRWERLFANLPGFEYAEPVPALAAFFCRRWNGAHAGDERVVEVRIVGLREMTKPGGEHLREPPRLLWRAPCADGLVD